MRVGHGFRHALHAVARRLADEARAAVKRVPVIVGEVMEGALRNSGPATPTGFECDSDVEIKAGDLAPSPGDHAGILVLGRADATFMGVRGQPPYCARRRYFIGKHGVRGADNLDFLKVAIGSGMEVRPTDIGGVGIIDPVPQALVLTAIVISFGMTAFVVILALRARGELDSDHVDGEGPPR